MLKTHEVDVRYNVIKKRMELRYGMNFIADMKEEASLIEVKIGVSTWGFRTQD